MRCICWLELIIAACQPVVGDDEDIQHHLLALPPPPSTPPHSKEDINLFKRWDKIAKRLILVLAGKARWCQARSFWACVVCCKSDVLAMSCVGSTNSQSVIQTVSQSAKNSVISKPLQTLLASSQDSCLEEVVFGVYTTLYIYKSRYIAIACMYN